MIGATGGSLVHIEQEQDGVLGIALSAVAGLAVGFVGGVILRQALGHMDAQPVKRVAGKLRRRRADRSDPEVVEQAVGRALDDNPDTSPLNLRVEALGDGIVELTGRAPDPVVRLLASDIARSVPGADVVVNRILVEGSENAASTTDIG
jgi:osmotically-inducible protein OsmY